MNYIRLFFNKDFFQSDAERISAFTIIDIFRLMCGLDEAELSFSESSDPLNTFHSSYSIISGNEQNKNVFNIDISKSMRQDPSKYLSLIFEKIITFSPNLEHVVHSFFKHRLWELELLLQFYSNNIRHNDYYKLFFSKNFEEISCPNRDSECLLYDNINYNLDDENFLYCQLYFKSLKKQANLEHKSSALINRELHDLANVALNVYYKRRNQKFIHLAGIISGKSTNIEISEDLYHKYILSLSLNNKPSRKISEAYYELGKIYENYFELANNTESIRKATWCFSKAYDYNSQNYRVLYKLIFSRRTHDFGKLEVNQLENLYKLLKKLEHTEKDLLNIHLYEYKILNHLGLYYTRWNQNKNSAMALINSAENEYDSLITVIWNSLGFREYKDSLELLQQYLMSRMLYHNKAIIYLRDEGANSTLYKDACKQLEACP